MDTSSPELCLLCCQIIGDYYGDFYQALFQKLTELGRCSAQQLAQSLHVPLRNVKNGLAGLVTLRLVFHCTVHDGPTTYTADLRGVYQVLRIGKLVQLAHNDHGSLAARIIETACNLKHCTLLELVDRVSRHDEATDESTIRSMVQALIADQYLINLRATHLKATSDVHREIESSMGSAVARITGTKAKIEHEEQVRLQTNQSLDTSTTEYGYCDTRGTRPTEGDQNGAVRAPQTNDMRDERLLQPNLYRVVLHAEMQGLRASATRTHGSLAAKVLVAAAKIVANPNAWTPSPVINFKTKSLQKTLVIEADHEQSDGNDVVMSNGNGSLDRDTSSVTIAQVEASLSRLAEGPYIFIEHMIEDWYIDKSAMDKYVREEELFKVLESRIPQPAPRILRILMNKGKLEERTLQELGLLGARDLKQALLEMKRLGFIDLQEIPRNAQRQPNQTVFLWFHDHERVQRYVLEGIYKSMTRLLQLLDLERTKIESTLAKIERDDVKGNEKQALGQAEYAVLSRYRKVEAWLNTEIARLDDSVAILRDVPTVTVDF
ncbi:hypothetical protein BT93_L4520 [Corymbia citriodora subsp. variegata]|uniref:DNA-directed RNA polymerase III subunit RPC3 n=1 Tax=Corymbia citriodora subsp. variegata TaxID=360336 RepID=A0A8T0CFS0_CORYI|nr:hypothetical protein BT93_L4520 [Corymbia citriodora subsp. variegata]